jgi:glycosyltransferase involved in cell wall biosynthesis
MSNFNTEFVDFPEAINNTFPDNPTVSIVIPVYIRTKKDIQDIHNLINSINKQTLRPDHTILIDDCSPASFNYPAEIIYKKLSKNSGPAKARNAGKNIALDLNSDIIAFTDSDCILSEK